MLRVAINGYGRIGRLVHRVILEKFSSEIEVAGINAGSSTDIKGWEYLLKYDSAYGQLSSKFKVQSSKLDQNDQKSKSLGTEMGYLIVDGKSIPVFSEKDPSFLPWKFLGVDVVIESTGVFKKEEQLKVHLESGAKAVILSAPSKSDSSTGSGQVPTYVLSVNDKDYKGEKIISNASCTTNCISLVAKIMQDNFGIEKAMMTTIHGYTSDQRLQDGGHKDYRRSRAAGANIIPTSTGATKAMGKVIPSLLNKFDGLAIRVPVITGSLADFTFLLSEETTVEEVNGVFKKEAEGENYKGILAVTEDPIVSSDIIGSSYSSIVDLGLTQAMGRMVKVIAWYDNEWGYANRLVEEILMVSKFK